MRRRNVPFVAVTALLAASALTSCSSATSAESCEPLLSAGALSSSVEVRGETAADIGIKVDSSLEALTAQRSVVREAESRDQPVKTGSIVAANLAYIDATSGEVLEASQSFGTGTGESLFLADPAAGPIVASTICAVPGDTLAIALSPQESAAMGLNGTLVVVAEIAQTSEARAEGKSRALPFGFPAVATDDTGRPGIVLPPQEAPAEERSALRIEGTGAKVGADDTVIGQVLTVAWNGTEERNTWEQGPVSFGNESQIEQSGATFRTALTGRPLGSQVVVIEPASDSAPARVSVIDILAAV